MWMYYALDATMWYFLRLEIGRRDVSQAIPRGLVNEIVPALDMAGKAQVGQA